MERKSQKKKSAANDPIDHWEDGKKGNSEELLYGAEVYDLSLRFTNRTETAQFSYGAFEVITQFCFPSEGNQMSSNLAAEGLLTTRKRYDIAG